MERECRQVTIYDAALKAAKQGEAYRWQEARAIRVALKAGGTIREYATLRDKNHQREQRYSNWVVAAEFVDTVRHKFEGELSELNDAGMTFITYYAEIGRYWKEGATPEECFDLLAKCVTPDGLRGVDYLRAQIDGIIKPRPGWKERAVRVADMLEKFVNDESIGAPPQLVVKLLPIIKTVVILLREAAK